MNQQPFQIVKWGRYFAVFQGETLVCVCVYKRGAREVIRRLTELANHESRFTLHSALNS